MRKRAAKGHVLAGIVGVWAALGVFGCQEEADDPAEPFVATRAYPGPCLVHEDLLTPYFQRDLSFAYDEAERVSVEVEHEPQTGSEKRHDYTYDEAGAMIRDDLTQRTDGVVIDRESTITSYHDGLVDVVRTLVFEGDTPTPVQETRYFYDADRLLVRTETTSLETATRLGSSDYEYDAAHRLVLEVDRNAEGQAWFWRTNEYDLAGLVTEASSTWLSSSSGPLRKEGFWQSFSYDSEGRVILEEIQSFASDVVNLAISYAYDSEGRLVMREEDGRYCMAPGEVDGVIEERYEFGYDAFGNLLLATRDGYDHGAPADGVIDGTSISSYACWEP